ncbi:MAG: hypothetical protein Fur0037_04680 [Planctomycetota bacterium]
MEVSQRFGWQEAAARCLDFAREHGSARGNASGTAFEAFDRDGRIRARLVLPRLLPPIAGREGPAAYSARIEKGIGRQAIVLLQAGAAALGYWREDDLVRHKAWKRYVVRGAGRAQPKHLRTKGKSRYGSRLRLQNFRLLLSDVNERLRDWWSSEGPPEQVFLGVNVRVLADLFAADPPPPFDARDPSLRRIGRHVHVPDFAELEAVRRFLARGRIEVRRKDGPGGTRGAS